MSFPMVDELSLYPSVSSLRYPKAGEPNARVRVGVISVTGGATRWLETGADSSAYLTRMQWAGNDSLAVVRLPRRQNRVDLLMLSAASGQGRTMEIDQDAAYVGSGLGEANGGGVIWLHGGDEFLGVRQNGVLQVFIVGHRDIFL